MKSPFWACLFSVLVPGLGQLYLGERAKGWTFLCMMSGVAIALIVNPGTVTWFLMGGIYLGIMIPAARDAFQTASGRSRTFAVPIPINFKESENGAVQGDVHEKKIKTWAGETVLYVIVMLFMVGPFAIPLLWQSPRFSKVAKIAWTATVIVIALLAIGVLAVVASVFDPLMS